MKYISVLFIFIFIFSSSNLLGQDNNTLVITYSISYNTELPNVKEGRLEINEKQDQSIFIITAKNETKKNVEIDEDNQVKIMSTSKKLRFVHFDSTTDSIFSTVKLYGENHLIKEKTPNITWNLTDETKKIGNFNVQRATASFRGRNYTAWYCSEYPIKFGPWKFHGLPGLIIEIFDETNRYHWIIKSIMKSSESTLANIDKSIYKEISIEEYVDIRYNKKPDYISTKLPRNAKIVSFEKPTRNSIETKFEWEKETKE